MPYQQRRFCVTKLPQVVEYFFTHRDERIAGSEKIFCKRVVTRAMFMRNYIIGNTHNPGMLIFFHPAQYRAQCRPHKRKPKAHNNEIGHFFAQAIAGFYPIERIYGIYERNYFDTGGSRFVTILGSAWKKKRGVLQRK